MKTALYNPIFINPQAYFVFPQLYDIEPKLDNYIENAIFTGFLEINPVNEEDATLISNTKQIDLSKYAGKHVRISQYTNLGSTVLGEWLLPKSENKSSYLLLESENKSSYLLLESENKIILE